MPPVCCRCNASGSCKNCSCKKANRKCLNRLPHRCGHCVNYVQQPLSSVTDPAPVSTHPLTSPHAPGPPEAPERTLGAPEPAGAQLSFAPAIATPAINVDLPPFTPISTPDFCWSDVDGEAFTSSINRCYEVIVHWRRNLFKVPSGKAGKAFVQELVRMFHAYANASALESVAMKAAMVMPALLLQKPHPRSKAKDHTIHLERRLRLWSEGDLMKEGYTIQHHLSR